MLPVLRAAAGQLAGEDGVRQVIGRRFVLYPPPTRSQDEWASWWADYFDVLADVPWAALEAAMLVWVAKPDSEFMPKPGKLLDIARATPCKAIQTYTRAKRAVEMEPPHQGEPIDQGKLKTMMADLTATLAATAEAARGPKPSLHGETGEGGVTPELRAIMKRRAAA